MIRLTLASLVLLLVAVPSVSHAANKPVVAVLYFDNNSGDEELDSISKGFADMVITDMSDSEQVTVVEREKLQSLIDESKLQRSRFFDKKTAVKIGKGLGASHVVSGSFTVVNERMRVDVRFIELATSKVVLTTQVTGKNTEIFELEQKLVADFLRKLNLKFSPVALPPTKVPNLKALLAYSKGLALMDQGDDTNAALMLKSAVQLAPAFGLARLRQSTILARLEASKTQRASVLDASAKGMFQRARSFVDGNKIEALAEPEAKAYLAYRSILGSEILLALHAATSGRRSQSRIVPRKSARVAVGLMKAYFENERLLIAELQAAKISFPSIDARLPDDEDARARELKLDYRDSFPGETLLRFALEGRADDSTDLGSFHIAPALVDLDPKRRKLTLEFAEQLTSAKSQPSVLHEQLAIVRVHEIVAEYLINRSKVEEGIAEYQKILDRFPTLPRWDYYEKLIKQQLGLAHDHTVRSRTRFAKGLQQCITMDMNVGMSVAMGQRVSVMGLDAYPAMVKELEKSCKKSPNLPKMQELLYRSIMLSAANYDDCELFDKYMALWLSVGGSKTDSVGYRKNYSSCPAP